MDREWLCLLCQPMHELETVAMFRDLGVNAFHPIHMKTIKQGRGSRRVPRPLLGYRYVFVEGPILPYLAILKIHTIQGYIGNFNGKFYVPSTFGTPELARIFNALQHNIDLDLFSESDIMCPLKLKVPVTLSTGTRAILIELRGGHCVVKIGKQRHLIHTSQISI